MSNDSSDLPRLSQGQYHKNNRSIIVTGDNSLGTNLQIQTLNADLMDGAEKMNQNPEISNDTGLFCKLNLKKTKDFENQNTE